MEAKNNTSNSEILDGTIEYLEQNYKTVDTLPAESSKPELETVVNGIIASNSTVRKNLDPVPPIFAKYNGHWYKWCPNCRQYHPIEYFNRHRGYTAHGGYHNVCVLTVRVFTMTNNAKNPMTIDDIMKMSDKSVLYKPLRRYEGFILFKRRSADSKKKITRAKLREIRGIKSKADTPVENTESPLFEPAADTAPVPASVVEQPVDDAVIIKIPDGLSDMQNMTALGQKICKRVLTVMQNHTMNGKPIAQGTYAKIAAQIMAECQMTQHDLSFNAMATVYNSIAKKSKRQKKA